MQPPTEKRFEPTDSESLTGAIVVAVATAEGSDPSSVTPRLYDIIDPDALARMFDREGAANVSVTFEYGDWLVRVQDNLVTVTDPTETASAGTESVA